MFELMASVFKKSRLPRSLVGRALLAAVSALLLVIALIGCAIATLLALQTEPFSWEGPAAQEEAVESSMHFDAKGQLSFIELPATAAESYDVLSKDMAFQVLDAYGREISSSPPGEALEALRRVPVHATEHMTKVFDRIQMQVLTSPIERNGTNYLIRDLRSERLATGIRSNGSMIFYYGGVGATVFAVIVFSSIVLWMARRAVKPLEEASAAAAAIEPGNLKQRVQGKNLPSELTPLIDAFNGALERLERGYRVQQEFLASAAHELKTPLALMRAELELGNVNHKDVLLKDIDLMGLQVQQLLQLAEVSEIQNFHFSRVDVREVVEETVSYAARFADSQEVHLHLIVDGDTRQIEADGGALSTLVKNLIENAVHHSSVGGVVTIGLTAGGISVKDTGPGVAPEDVPNLFTRFWRSERASHQGAGLGLSICQSIAAAHAWKLAYRTPAQGNGAEFILTF